MDGIRNVQFAVPEKLGKAKDQLKKVTWPMIVEAGITHYQNTNGTEKPEEEKTSENYYFRLDKEEKVLVREFDLLADNQWVMKPFEEIPIGATFRTRDDAAVLSVEGYKRFVRVGDPFVKDGQNYVEVTAIK